MAPASYLPRAVLPVRLPARDPGPLRDASWGDPGLVGPRSRYPSARGTGASVEIVADPSAGRGVGECAGAQRRADRFRRIGVSRIARLLWQRGDSARREAADDIWMTDNPLSAARKRTGSSSPPRAAAIIRLAMSLRTPGAPPS
jgi:hypothetical protein